MTGGAKKPALDWERIEADYRAGAKSVREIAAEHGITHGAVNKRVKRDGWTRDLAPKVRAKADALVSKDAVSTAVSTVSKATETQVVEAEAQVQARIRLTHRADIARARGLANALLTELEQSTENRDLVEQLRDALLEQEENADAKRRLWDAWGRAMSLSGRVDTMKRLAETLRIVIDKEREAFGIELRSGSPADGLPVVTVKDMTGRKYPPPAPPEA